MNRPVTPRAARRAAPLALLALLACGQEEAPTPVPQPSARPARPQAQASTPVQPEVQVENADPRQLVPDGAILWAECTSMDELMELFEPFAQSFGEDTQITLDVNMALSMLAQYGADPEQVRRGAPMGIALTIPEGAQEPVPTFVLPVNDGLVFQRSLSQDPKIALARLGHYVAVSLDPNYSSSSERGLAFCADLPEATFVCRVAVEPLMQRFGPMVQMGLGSMAQQAREGGVEGEAEEALDSLVQTLLTTLQGTRSFDLALNEDGGRFDMDLQVRLLPNSPLAAEGTGSRSLADVARYVDVDDTLAVLACCDASLLDGPFGPLLEFLEQASPELDLDEFLGDEGVALAAFGRFHPGSVEAAVITQGVDPRSWDPVFDGFAAGLSEDGSPMALHAPMQADEGDSRFRQVDLVPGSVQDTQLQARLGEVFGAPRARLRMVSIGDQVVLGLGEGQALAQRATGMAAELPEDLERALDLCGDAGNAFVYRVDYRGLAMDAGAMLMEAGADPLATFEQALERPDDDPAWAVVHGCMDGPTWRLGISFRPDEFLPHMAQQQAVLHGGR